MAAINSINRAGGIRQAVETGVLKSGVMFECVTHGVDYVLAGSIRDDGPLPETSDLVAGWYMSDVESHERALELAAYVSSEPGPGGEPLYEWIDVREVMSGAPSED